jgi:hypothetical protein
MRNALLTAPAPRPPQPIKPILIVSLPAAWAPRATGNVPATAAVTAEAFKKLRRVVAADDFFVLGLDMVGLLVAGWGVQQLSDRQ